MIRRVNLVVGTAAWTILAVTYWLGAYEPAWWFVGLAFTLLALDFLLKFLEDTLSS